MELSITRTYKTLPRCLAFQRDTKGIWSQLKHQLLLNIMSLKPAAVLLPKYNCT